MRGAFAAGANRLNQTGHTYGSCKGKDAQGYGRAETEVQAETLTATLVAQSCRAMALAVAVMAAAEAEKLRATTEMAQSFAREGEYEVTEWPTPSPLLIAK